MGIGPGPVPVELARGLFRVDTPLLASRYSQALRLINRRSTTLARFHVDALGWSPEIARELGDPYYLGQGVDHPFFVILSVDQVDGPILQPNSGFAAAPFRRFVFEQRSQIAFLTLSEPVFGAVDHGLERIVRPSDLGVVDRLEIDLRTPSDRIRQARELERMRRLLLETDHSWHDEPFVERMLAVSRAVDGFFPVPETLHGPRFVTSPCFLPSFGGSYFYPRERGLDDGMSYLLTAAFAPSQVTRAFFPERPEGVEETAVEIVELSPEPVLAFLAGRGILELSIPVDESQRRRAEEILGWIAIDHLVASQWDLGPDGPEMTLADAVVLMRTAVNPPAEYLELEQAVSRMRRRAVRLDLSDFSPITRLRLSSPLEGDPHRVDFVRHLQAFLDPLDLSGAHGNAPDLLFGRFDSLPSIKKQLLLTWIRNKETAPWT